MNTDKYISGGKVRDTHAVCKLTAYEIFKITKFGVENLPSDDSKAYATFTEGLKVTSTPLVLVCGV